MGLALGIYHKLPPFSRSIVASARGYYLSWWRYGKQTEKLVEEALERDHWSENEWSSWQSERLSFVLHRAATRVPYYREMWADRRRNGDTSSWEYLENWPILEKKELRANSAAFVADDCSTSKMFRDHTSGTTGTSLDLWLSGGTVKKWYALHEARSRRWYGLNRRDRWAILGGQLISPVSQKKPPFWVWNAGLNQLYLSSYHLSPDLIASYLDAIIKYRVKYVLGYPSAIYALALASLQQGRTDLQLDVAITNAEPLYPYQREAIESAFSCPVRETYGMAEIVAAASECGSGNMHMWPDTGIIEIDQSSQAGVDGDFVCTGLVNSDMPLIRYRVGDSGSLSKENCSCGKKLPLLGKIEGRNDDVLLTVDGKRIGRMDPVFKSDLQMIEAQLIQNSLRSIDVKYVPAKDFHKSSLIKLTKLIRQRMGDIEVSFEELPDIPRTSRGKFRAVICNVPEAERLANAG